MGDNMSNIRKKRISNTPFDDVFRTLLEKCNKLIIPVINEFFHTDYTFKDEVLVLANDLFYFDEDGNDVKRVTDSYLKLRDNIYHLECQSSEDTYMELRMMEYDFHIAFDNVSDDEKSYVAKLPQSAVLNLYSSKEAKESMEVTILIPTYFNKPSIVCEQNDRYFIEGNGVVYEKTTYTVPVFDITQYTHEEIHEKSLLFLTPYYIMKFKESLSELNEDEDALNKFTEEQHMLYCKLEELSMSEGFTRDYVYDVVSLTEKIINYVAKDMENVKRKVAYMGGEILKTDREILMEESEARGKTVGIIEGEDLSFKLASAMLADGCDNDAIIKLTSDREYREKMFKKYNLK